MRKIVLLFLVLASLGLPVLAQNKESNFMIRMKGQLPFTLGEERAECLNTIASAYINNGIVRSDSGLKYAVMAYNWSKLHYYKRALGKASLLYARVLLQLSRVNEGITYYRETCQLANELNNDTMASNGLRGVGQALWYQGNFQQSIDTIKLSIDYFTKLNNISEIADAFVTIADVYGDQGNYEKAFEKAREGLRLNDSLKNKYNVVLSLAQLGTLYKSIGDYTSAMDYYRKGYNLFPDKESWSYRHLSHLTGDLFCELQQFDSAQYYYRQSFSGDIKNKSARMRLGNFFLQQKKYDSALYYFSGLYSELKGGGEGNIYFNIMLGMGKLYLQTGELSKATFFADKTLDLAQIGNSKLVVRDACRLLSQIYDTLKQPGPAFRYYKQYVAMKDSVITDQFKGKLYAFKQVAEDEKKLAQIELLQKEKLISEQKLKGNNLLRNILLIGIISLAIIGFIIFRNIILKRKNEKLESERIQTVLQKRASDLEMQALRAQMNPHFIFNCLSSINRFILKNEPDKASDYLTSFSRLIRLVLINSQKSLIVLEDEVEMLRLYIEMEQLRFKNSFDYSITYSNNIEQANVLIPPLLLQPFCENAIWHGLMHKEGRGHLSITFAVQQNSLRCVITDDGIGRAKAGELKNQSPEKLKSLGLKLTAERLALFNEDNSVKTFYEMEDITDEDGNIKGTKVILHIRYKEFTTETSGYKV